MVCFGSAERGGVSCVATVFSVSGGGQALYVWECDWGSSGASVVVDVVGSASGV